MLFLKSCWWWNHLPETFESTSDCVLFSLQTRLDFQSESMRLYEAGKFAEVEIVAETEHRCWEVRA